MTDWTWMRELCSTDEHREKLHHPFVVTVDGEPHTMATDAMKALLVRGIVGEPKRGDEYERMSEGVISMLPKGAPRVVDVAALKAFIGVVEREPDAPPCPACNGRGVEACEECNGDGEMDCECLECGHEHTVTCDECSGDGEVPCGECGGPRKSRPEPVRIFGSVFDRRVLYPALRHLPDERAAWRHDDPTRAASLRGDGWLLLLMPLRWDGSAESAARPAPPEFWTEAAAA